MYSPFNRVGYKQEILGNTLEKQMKTVIWIGTSEKCGLFLYWNTKLYNLPTILWNWVPCNLLSTWQNHFNKTSCALMFPIRAVSFSGQIVYV